VKKYWIEFSFADIINANSKKEAKKKVMEKISKEGYFNINKAE